MKSGAFVAHENPDVINMEIRKQTAQSLRLVLNQQLQQFFCE